MSYIYHLKPNPMHGNYLIPLNEMEWDSDLYVKHSKKYKGRESLMDTTIPTLNCKWNDVVQFSALDPQVIVNELARIDDDIKLLRLEYYKIPIEVIKSSYDGVIFDRKVKMKGSFEVAPEDVSSLEMYREIHKVPDETINYWRQAKARGEKMLWFPFVPHIFIKGKIDISPYEICQIDLFRN